MQYLDRSGTFLIMRRHTKKLCDATGLDIQKFETKKNLKARSSYSCRPSLREGESGRTLVAIRTHCPDTKIRIILGEVNGSRSCLADRDGMSPHR